MTDLLQRTPPTSIEAEACVLGSMMLDASCIPTVMESLNESDFYRPAHQIIFRGLCQMNERRVPIDLVSVKDALVKAGKLEEVGGLDYVAALVEGVPSSANVEYYANIVSEKAKLRNLILLGTDIAREAYDPATDVDEMLGRVQNTVYGLSANVGKGRTLTAAEAGRKVMLHTERVANGDESAGLSTGFTMLDKCSGGGLKPGQLVIIAAPTSQGKSSLANCIAVNVARDAGSAKIFSAEMSNEEFAQRILSSLANVNGLKISNARSLSADEWTRLHLAQCTLEQWGKRFELTDLPMCVPAMENEVRKMSMRIGDRVGLVIVDYAQIIPGPEKDLRERVGNVSRQLLLMAKALQTPVILASQIKRIEGRRPEIYDLKESGDIENNADVVILLHRPEPYIPDIDGGYIMEAKVAKVRNGMRTDWDGPDAIKFRFVPQYTRFEAL